MRATATDEGEFRVVEECQVSKGTIALTLSDFCTIRMGGRFKFIDELGGHVQISVVDEMVGLQSEEVSAVGSTAADKREIRVIEEGQLRKDRVGVLAADLLRGR